MSEQLGPSKERAKSSLPRLRHFKRLRNCATPPIYKKMTTIAEVFEESKETKELLQNSEVACALLEKPECIVPSSKHLSTIVILPTLHLEEKRKRLPKNRNWKQRHKVILPQQNAVELRSFKLQDYMDQTS